jgi:hypothetical protein
MPNAQLFYRFDHEKVANVSPSERYPKHIPDISRRIPVPDTF